MRVSAIIIGIDGWETYTLPLVQSIQKYEPDCAITVVDNESQQPYPQIGSGDGQEGHRVVVRSKRLCYSAAINLGKSIGGLADWYIVLSNDVLCTGPFIKFLRGLPTDIVAGPQLMRNQGWSYIEGWCVCIPANVWDALGGWDEEYQISSWEDVDISTSAIELGYHLRYLPYLPFKHLDQKQRFTIVPDYWNSESHNVRYFSLKHGAFRG